MTIPDPPDRVTLPTPGFEAALHSDHPSLLPQAIDPPRQFADTEPPPQRETTEPALPPAPDDPIHDTLREIQETLALLRRELGEVKEIAIGARDAVLHQVQDEIVQGDRISALRRDVDSLECRRPPPCPVDPHDRVTLTAIPGGAVGAE